MMMIRVGVAILTATCSPECEMNPRAIARTLCVAYAATIGGLGTLVGSPTKAIAAGLVDKRTGFRIDFLTWAMFGLPIVVMAFPLAWILLIRTTRLSAGRARKSVV